MSDLADKRIFESEFLLYIEERKHVMLLYEDVADYRYVAARFIADGLRKKDKCVMATDDYGYDDVLHDLESLGVDVPRALDSRRLVLIDVGTHYASERAFDPHETIRQWQRVTDEAVDQGFANVRAVGEATFSLQGEKGGDKLIYYENLLNDRLFPHYPFMSLCVYDKRRYSTEVIKAAIQSHPMLVYGRKIFKNNIYFVPPEIFFSRTEQESEIDRWLANVEFSNGIVQDIVQQEAKTATLFNSANDAFFIHEIEPADEASFIEVNDVACRMLGYDREALLGLKVLDIVTAGPRLLRQAVHTLMKREQVVFEVELRTRRGEVVPVEVNTSLFYLEGRRVAFSAARDLTDLKRTENDLKQVLDATNDGMWTYYPLTGDFTCSRRWMEMLGYAPDEVLEDVFFSEGIIHPDDREQSRRVFSEYMRGERTSYESEFRLRAGDGNYKWVNTRGRIVERDARGRPVRVMGAHTDIDERKRAEEALRESETRFRMLYKDAPVPYQSLDENGNLLEVNTVFCQTLGYTREELLGRNFSELLHPKWQAHFRDNFPHFKAVGEVVGVEFELRRKDGEYILVAFSGRIGKTTNGGFRQTHCVFRDITSEREHQNALIKAKEEAEAANQAKSVFLANMSHELRTPLNGIVGMNQLLQTTSLDAEQQEYVDMAIQASQRLNGLMADILDLTKLEAGRMTIACRPFCLEEVFDDVDKLFRPSCLQKGLELSFLADGGISSRLMGDPIRLKQIFNHLVGNSVKFTEKGGIRVEAHPLPGGRSGEYRVLFSVSDSGIGIEDALLERLFESFTQADEGLMRAHQGAGLGLSIVRELVRRMRGSIAVVSEPGGGTAFHLSIGFKVQELGDGAGEEQCVLPDGQRVLVVEDDRFNRFALQGLLRKSGYEVRTAADGAEAIHALEAEDFSLVLIDIQLPVMNGLEAIRAIRTGGAGMRNTDIGIVALSAHPASENMEWLHAAGVDDHLAKPVKMEELRDCLGRLLPGRA